MPKPHDLVHRVRQSWRLLLKELSAFGVVGGICLVIELGLFQVLYAHLSVGAIVAKLVATVISSTAAYLGHRYWSFSHRARTGVKREYSLLLLVNGAALLVGLAMVGFVRYGLGQDSALLLQLTNIASIGIGTMIRFLCYRKWVFVHENSPAAVAHRLHQEQRMQARDTERAAA
jgi:putative flippase GtrA